MSPRRMAASADRVTDAERLDLHHVGALLGQDHRGVGPRHHLAEIDHPYTLEWLRRAPHRRPPQLAMADPYNCSRRIESEWPDGTCSSARHLRVRWRPPVGHDAFVPSRSSRPGGATHVTRQRTRPRDRRTRHPRRLPSPPLGRRCCRGRTGRIRRRVQSWCERTRRGADAPAGQRRPRSQRRFVPRLCRHRCEPGRRGHRAGGLRHPGADPLGRPDRARRPCLRVRWQQHRGRASPTVRDGPRRNELLPDEPQPRPVGREPRGARLAGGAVPHRPRLLAARDRAESAERPRRQRLRDRAPERHVAAEVVDATRGGSPRTLRWS